MSLPIRRHAGARTGAMRGAVFGKWYASVVTTHELSCCGACRRYPVSVDVTRRITTQIVYLPLHKAWLGGDADAEAMIARSGATP
jgi:hypothetical protein